MARQVRAEIHQADRELRRFILYQFCEAKKLGYPTMSAFAREIARGMFNTGRQVAYTAGVAIAVTVISARLNAVGGDAAAAADRLGAYQYGFLACGLLIFPAAVISWRVRDDDVASTRGLPVPEPAGVGRPLVG